jgi:hypothetical protein
MTAAGPRPSDPAAALDAETIAELTHLLRGGRAAEAEQRLGELDLAGDPQRAMLDAVAAEPHVRTALETLEEWLDGTVDAEAAMRLATSWALPAADLDLDTVNAEVRLYIDAYPLEARVLGGLPGRATTWLVARLAQTIDPAQRLPAIRRAVASLADAAAPGFPASAASLRAADGLDDEALWRQLALGIVKTEISKDSKPS